MSQFVVDGTRFLVISEIDLAISLGLLREKPTLPTKAWQDEKKPGRMFEGVAWLFEAQDSIEFCST